MCLLQGKKARHSDPEHREGEESRQYSIFAAVYTQRHLL
jgi:hypothetical protein